ncbi:RNA-directed DNA polymerase, eukaryota [Tanacetum coccineum]
MDKLPTRLNLSLRGVDIPSILCPVCDVAVESTSHILFSCPLARDVLCKVMTWWDLDTPNILSYEEWLCWFSNLHIHKQAKIILEGVFYVMWWLIWRFRNKSLFGSSTPRKAIIFDEIDIRSKLNIGFMKSDYLEYKGYIKVVYMMVEKRSSFRAILSGSKAVVRKELNESQHELLGKGAGKLLHLGNVAEKKEVMESMKLISEITEVTNDSGRQGGPLIRGSSTMKDAEYRLCFKCYYKVEIVRGY